MISRDDKGDSRHNLRWGNKERQRQHQTTYVWETRHGDATEAKWSTSEWSYMVYAGLIWSSTSPSAICVLVVRIVAGILHGRDDRQATTEQIFQVNDFCFWLQAGGLKPKTEVIKTEAIRPVASSLQKLQITRNVTSVLTCDLYCLSLSMTS